MAIFNLILELFFTQSKFFKTLLKIFIYFHGQVLIISNNQYCIYVIFMYFIQKISTLDFFQTLLFSLSAMKSDDSFKISIPSRRKKLKQLSSSFVNPELQFFQRSDQKEHQMLQKLNDSIQVCEQLLGSQSQSRKEIGMKHIFQLSKKTPLPTTSIQILKRISKNYYDPLNGQANRILNENAKNSRILPPKVAAQMSQKIAMVSKEQVTLKKQQNFRKNILDMNLQQNVANQRVNRKTAHKQIQSNRANLPDQHGQAQTKWYRSKLAQVQLYLEKSRQLTSLNDGDLKYISQKCMYQPQNSYMIGRCDPAIFEIIKYQLKEPRVIPQGFFKFIEQILNKNFKHYSDYEMGFLIKQAVNLFSFSLLNRYDFRFPLYPNDITNHLRNSVPQIIYQYVLKEGMLEESLINALINRAKQSDQDQYVNSIVHSAAFMLIREDAKYSQNIKEIKCQQKGDKFPQSACLYYEVLGQYKFGLPKQCLQFLCKSIKPILYKQEVDFFFNPKQKIYIDQSASIRNLGKNSYQNIDSLYLEKEKLKKVELVWLISEFRQNANDDGEVMNNYKILACFRKWAYKGGILPNQVVSKLKNIFSSNYTEINMKRHIGLILFYSFRNGQQMHIETLSKINELIKNGRKSAFYALGYYIDEKGVKELDKIETLIEYLKKTIRQNDSFLKQAVIFTMRSIIKYRPSFSFDKMQQQLTTNPELIESFFYAAMNQQIFEQSTCTIIAKVMSNEIPCHNELIRTDCAMILSFLAQNLKQQIPDESIKLSIQNLMNKQADIRNSLASMVGYLAVRPTYRKKIIQLKPGFLDLLTNSILCYEKVYTHLSSALVIFVKSGSCQKIISSQAQNNLKQIIEKNTLQLKTRENIALAIGHSIDKQHTAGINFISGLLQVLLKQKSAKIKKSLISAIGKSLKKFNFSKNSNDKPLLEKMMLKIIILLDDFCEDLSDSARVIIEQYIELNKELYDQKFISELVKILMSPNASLNASHLLKILSQKNPEILMNSQAIFHLSKVAHQIQNPEAIQKISYIFSKISHNYKLGDDTLNQLVKMLNNNNMEVSQNITCAIRNSCKEQTKLTRDMIYAMCDIINSEQKITLLSKQNIAQSLKIVSINFDYQMYLDILEDVIAILILNDTNISCSILQILGNYFKFAFQKNQQQQLVPHEEIVRCLERQLQNLDLIAEGVYAIHQAVQRGFKIQEDSLQLLSKTLLSSDRKKTRKYALNILKKCEQNLEANSMKRAKKIYDIQVLVDEFSSSRSKVSFMKIDKQIISSDNDCQINYSVFQIFQLLLLQQSNKVQLSMIKKSSLNYSVIIMNLLVKISEGNRQIPNSLIKKVVNRLQARQFDQTSQKSLKLLFNVSKKTGVIPLMLVDIIEDKIQRLIKNQNAQKILQIALIKNYQFKNQSHVLKILIKKYVTDKFKYLPEYTQKLSKKFSQPSVKQEYHIDLTFQYNKNIEVIKFLTKQLDDYLVGKNKIGQKSCDEMFHNLNTCIQLGIQNHKYYDIHVGNILKLLLRNQYELKEKTLQYMTSFLTDQSFNPSQKQQIYEILNSIQKKKEKFSQSNFSSPKADSLQVQEDLKKQLRQALKNQSYFDINQKSLDQLLEQVKKTCQNTKLMQLIENGFFNKKITQIQKTYHKKVGIFSTKSIKDWSQQNIRKWVRKIKKQDKKPFSQEILTEIFAVIKRAVVLDSQKNKKHHQLRNTQLLSVLMMLQCEKSVLSQISTGEGKSTIVSILAVIKGLQGYKVDIITSSLVLAKRDAKEKQRFYTMFDLVVQHNGDDSFNGRDVKACYRQNIDIIYGDASGYQFDILRHQYSGLNTRGERKFQQAVAIVDQVDSMLIDDSSKIAMLADSMPGMNNLNVLLVFIWQQLDRMIQRLEPTQTGYKYRCQGNKFQQINNEEYKEFLKKKLLDYVQKLLKQIDPNSQNRIGVYPHFEQYAEKQKIKWVQNAIEAKFIYKKQHHYLIAKDGRGVSRIVPIDYANTGVIQKNTTWGDGLHQFLQIKQGLQTTPETLITNFLSNKAYFSRYENRIYGLTGTLGSKRAKDLLNKIYKVEFIHVPRYKRRNFIEYRSQIKENEMQWIKTIIQSIVEINNQERACLIICQTKFKAYQIYEQLKLRKLKDNLKGDIRLYTRDDTYEIKSPEKILNSGDILIATNLAGRGTDIKTSNIVETKGGLHVCVTFLPSNLRVQQQAFGRTARQGNKGSAQLILNKSDLPCMFEQQETVEEIRQERDKLQKSKLDNFQSDQLRKIDFKDQIFKEFCCLITQLRQKFQRRNSNSQQMIKHEQKMKAIEQRWGLFLKHLNLQNTQLRKKQFEKFKQIIFKQYTQDKVIKNPQYYIRAGNGLLDHAQSIGMKILNSSFAYDIGNTLSAFYNKLKDVPQPIQNKLLNRKKLFRKAQQAYTSAINIENNRNAQESSIAFNAFYKRAFTHIQLQELGYKQKAAKDLQKAVEIIQKIIVPQQIGMQLNFSNITGQSFANEFLNQITIKLAILKAISDSINNSISVIERSIHYIQVNKPQGSVIVKNCEQATKQIQNMQRNPYLMGRRDNQLIDLGFYHLKSYSDIKEMSQSEAVMSYCFKFISTFDKGYLNFFNQEKNQKKARVGIQLYNLNHKNAISTMPAYNSMLKQIKLQKKEGISRGLNKNKKKENIMRSRKESRQFKYGGHRGYDQKYGMGSKLQRDLLQEWETQQQICQLLLTLEIDSLSVEKATFVIEKCIQLTQLTNDEEIQLTIQNKVQNLTLKSAKKFIDGLSRKIQDCANYMIAEDIQKNKKSNMNININRQSVQESIIKKLSEIQIKLKIPSLTQMIAKFLIDSTQTSHSAIYSICFETLKQDQAHIIIKNNKEIMRHSKITVKSLAPRDASKLLQKFPIKQEPVVINTISSIEQVFYKYHQSTAQIIQAKNQGIDSLIDLNEQQPIKWKSAAILGSLGAMQIVAGCFLMTIPNLGFGLISEGAGDLFWAMKGIQNQEFSWGDYATYKTVSLVISGSTGFLGLGNNSSAIALSGLESIDQVAIKYGLQQYLRKDKKNTAKQKFQADLQSFQNHQLTNIVTQKIEEVAYSKIKTSAIDQALRYSIQKLDSLPKIKIETTKMLQEKLSKIIQFQILQKYLMADQFYQNKNLQSKILKIVQQIIDEKKDQFFTNLGGTNINVINYNKKIQAIANIFLDNFYSKIFNQMRTSIIQDMVTSGLPENEKENILEDLKKCGLLRNQQINKQFMIPTSRQNDQIFNQQDEYGHSEFRQLRHSDVLKKKDEKRFAFKVDMKKLSGINLGQNKNIVIENIETIYSLSQRFYTSEVSQLHKQICRLIVDQIISKLHCDSIQPMSADQISQIVNSSLRQMKQELQPENNLMSDIQIFQALAQFKKQKS